MALRAPALRRGDVIGVVAPSGAIREEHKAQLERGTQALRGLGFEVAFAPNMFERHYYSAGSLDERAHDINDLWQRRDVRMILMAQGGHSLAGLLDRLDYQRFHADPKIFMGFSDGTFATNAILSRSDLISFSGPDLIWGFGRDMDDRFRNNVVDVLSGWTGEYRLEDPRTVRGGKSSGPLVGGHSECFLTACYAGYAPDLDGAVLFIEGTQPVSQLERQFQAMRLHGVFERIAGLILGHFDGSAAETPDEDRAVADMVLEVTGAFRFPILEIKELGHNVEQFVFPLGCRVTLDATARSITLQEAAVC